MIARPHVPAPPRAVGALPRAARLVGRVRGYGRVRLYGRVRSSLFAIGHHAAALVARDAADDPTRFSPDAWKAWGERGTLYDL